MGGSSLAPEVMQKTFGAVKGFPELHVLDSTDPAQIARIEASVDLAHTLFIVSSKSGTTLETNLLFQYFLERVKSAVGDAHACGHFIAITDPDSPLQQVAEADRLPSGVFRCAEHRRPVFGALELRTGPSGVDWRRRRTASRPDGVDGAFLCAERPRRRESGGRPGRHPRDPRRRRP